MNNRLTIQDLAVLLAEHTGKDRASTERFLREFVAVVSEGVCADKLVKVKGLGIFKIIPVEKRESIHVNTGERFLIPEHYKFSFLPDKDLRELVNKPFSFFETTELSDSADFSDMDISEEEIEEKEVEDESVEEVIPEEKPLTGSEETEPLPEETDIIPLPEEPDAEPSAEEPVVDENPVADKAEPLQPQSEEVVQPQKETERIIVSKSRKQVRGLIAILVILLVVINTIVYLNRDYFTPAKNSLTEKPATKELKDTTKKEDTSYLIIPDSVESKRPRVQPAPYKAPEPDVLDSVKISRGDRLTIIALKYYGSKHFWVYLYEYNKAKIKDPNNVPIGTVIEVPAPHLYGIDAHDRASVEKATVRQTEILSGK